ncbi:MAG: DUF2974 domain-containing protein [Clostridia bacterium]|nr:DUF2974 domain-containing protein [Clostridia bacterium]
MGTVYDYLTWRGDLTFRKVPFGEVDSLILSMLSYLDMKDIVPAPGREIEPPSVWAASKEYLERYPDPKKAKMGVLIPKDIVKMMRAMRTTKRFGTIKMTGFVNLIDPENELQFSAVTFLLGDGTAVVTYRGTDDTLVGWKEDMNMCFLPVVPAQVKAVEYLESVAKTHAGKLILAGHSKGGNLAVYAAVHCDPAIRERITAVYSNDGPGFGKNILDDPDYVQIRPRICNLVPQSSVVGMLLEHDENYTVVKSRQKSGFLQHNGLSWEILGNSFVHLEDVTPESRKIDRTVNQWIRDMTPEQREEFAEAVYQLFSVDGAQTLTDLVAARKKWFSHTKSLDPKVHETIQKMLADLIGISNKVGKIKEFFRRGSTEEEVAE